MIFSEFKKKNAINFDFFTADEMSYKSFIQLGFDEFVDKYGDTSWILDIDNKKLNSYPNFTQKHQICISHKDFADCVFQFRISCENSTNSLGYRLFINLNDHFDFVSSDINDTDNVVIQIKNEILSEFYCVSKCGWWITDIWRDMFEITPDVDSLNFIENIMKHGYTRQMLKINEKFLKMQKDGLLKNYITQLKILK